MGTHEPLKGIQGEGSNVMYCRSTLVNVACRLARINYPQPTGQLFDKIVRIGSFI